MDNPLLKYSAKEYFFKASLCHFIVDELNAKASCTSGGVGEVRESCWRKFQLAVVSLQIAVEKYEEMFPAFSDSRECKLLKVAPRAQLPDFLSLFFAL